MVNFWVQITVQKRSRECRHWGEHWGDTNVHLEFLRCSILRWLPWLEGNIIASSQSRATLSYAYKVTVQLLSACLERESCCIQESEAICHCNCETISMYILIATLGLISVIASAPSLLFWYTYYLLQTRGRFLCSLIHMSESNANQKRDMKKKITNIDRSGLWKIIHSSNTVRIKG